MLPANLRHLTCSAIGAATLLVVFASLTSAQQIARGLSSGARVRLVAPEAGVPWSATAIVDSVSAETLYVRSLSEPPLLRSVPRVPIPFGSIRRLDVSGGRASRVGRAGRGALWGVAVYAIVAGTYIAHEKMTCQGPDCFGEGYAWIGLAAGVPWSAGVGAAVGASLPVERWHRLRLDGSRQ